MTKACVSGPLALGTCQAILQQPACFSATADGAQQNLFGSPCTSRPRRQLAHTSPNSNMAGLCRATRFSGDESRVVAGPKSHGQPRSNCTKQRSGQVPGVPKKDDVQRQTQRRRRPYALGQIQGFFGRHPRPRNAAQRSGQRHPRTDMILARRRPPQPCPLRRQVAEAGHLTRRARVARRDSWTGCFQNSQTFCRGRLNRSRRRMGARSATRRAIVAGRRGFR